MCAFPHRGEQAAVKIIWKSWKQRKTEETEEYQRFVPKKSATPSRLGEVAFGRKIHELWEGACQTHDPVIFNGVIIIIVIVIIIDREQELNTNISIVSLDGYLNL